MSSQDHEDRFFRHYERYEAAKHRGEDFREWALFALNEIHHISGVSAAEDRDANVRVLHRLLPILTEAQAREAYNQLREDAGI